MAMNQEVKNLCEDWVKWLDTRRFYCQPEQKNILALLMKDPRTSKGEPNADINPELVAFNLAVTSLSPDKFVPFVVVYCDYRPKPIKWMAHEAGMGKSQYYDTAHAAASKVLSVQRQLLEMSQMMRRELGCQH